MKEVWLLDKGDSWDEVKENVINAVELGFTGVLLKKDFEDLAKKIGRIEVGSDEVFEVRSGEDQEKAIELAEVKGRVFLDFENWKIIPLENIVAMKRKGKVIVLVRNLDEAKTVLHTLERGADGILVEARSRDELAKFVDLLRGAGKVNLVEAVVRRIVPLGVGDRVCVDTITLMSRGEGMLVGNKAGFLFLVASESEDSEYVSSRPFRVNAGSVNAYVKVGDKTKYLSELKAGDRVEIVKFDGSTRESYVGRVKIEKRPMVLVEAEFNGIVGSVILQNAETIKLVSKDGSHVSVSELKEGDEVLVWIGEKARHFGVEVEEFIIER